MCESPGGGLQDIKHFILSFNVTPKSVALAWHHDFRTNAPSTRIRFLMVFIETANFSSRCHLASIRKRSEMIIVFTENDNF